MKTPRILPPLLLLFGFLASVRGQQTAYDGGLVVDYADPGYSEGGAWETVTGNYYTTGQSGTDVRRSGQDGAWVKWAPKLPAAGKYRVFLWHIPGKDSGAKVEIGHDGKVEAATRDMQWGHIGWISLGDYDFAAGDGGYVKITRGTGQLLVDSVKFLPVDKVRPLPALPPYPKADGSAAHFDERGNLILGGKPYQPFYQELEEDTVSRPETIPTMDDTFDTALAQGVNTLGVTLMWKLFETSEGVYDYSVIDALIEKARARHMHLDLVLFFAWRNLQSYYVPTYISKDHDKYLEVKKPDGTDGGHYVVSPFADATREAETRALVALFHRVTQDDPDHQVVILAQLENEMPGVRDYSAPAQQAWSGPVPPELTAYLAANDATLDRTVWEAWHHKGAKAAGTWAEVFGDDDHGGRIFAAWSYGRYAEQVAGALKKELPIPLYMNAWKGESPSYRTAMDVFHAAAPSLDGMGPDAYGNLDTWEQDVGLEVRPWLHLTVAEQHHTTNTIWRAIANYNAVIAGEYFGVEGLDWLCSLETYRLIAEMEPLLAEKRDTGDLWGFFQNRHAAGESWSEYFQDLRLTYTATVRPHTFGSDKENPPPNEKVNNVTGGELDGCGLLVALGNGEYVATSTRIDLTLHYINGGPIDVAQAESGHFQDGAWVKAGNAEVRRQGDGVRLVFPSENKKYGQVRFRLATHAADPAQVYEAEKGKILGDVSLDYQGAASGALYVTRAARLGEGVEWATHAPFEAKAVTIRYAAESACHLTLLVNGTAAAEVDFPPTGSWANWSEKAVPVPVPVGATVTLRRDQGLPGPSLDCMILSASVPAAAAGGPQP